MPLSHLGLTSGAYHTACNSKTGERQEILHWLAYLCLKSLFLTEDRRAGNRREKEVLAAGLDALLAAENLTAMVLYNTVINKDLVAMTLIHSILDTLSVRSLTNSYTSQKGPGSTHILLLAGFGKNIGLLQCCCLSRGSDT